MKNQRNKGFIIGSGVFLFFFLMVAFFVSGTQGQLLDERVAYWAEGVYSATVETIMGFVSFFGSSELILLATIILGIALLIMRKWRHFFFFFVISLGGVFLNLILKLLVHRARPGEEKYIDVFNYQLEIQSYSFPSGHTMRATIFFLFLIYLVYYFGKRTITKWILYVLFTALIFAVPLSRIMLDAHFVMDVLGALLMSGAWFFFWLYFFHKPKEAGYSFYMHR